MNPTTERPGLLVAVEGVDGAGKTTLCEALADALRAEGRDVARLREPTDGPFGRRIRALAQEKDPSVTAEEELDLFIRDREQNVRENILPALERGAVVLLDRYYYSTIAYQGARGFDPEVLRARNEAFAPPADLLILLTLPMDWVARRIEESRGSQRDHFESEERLRRVAEIFDAMTGESIVRIDGRLSLEDVLAEARRALDPLLPEPAR